METKLNDLCVRVLLRCFCKNTDSLHTISPKLKTNDQHFLRVCWALSDWVGKFATYLNDHPREVLEVFSATKVINSGESFGSLDARESLLMQERLGDPTLFVIHDINSTFFSTPNHLLVWTLCQARSSLAYCKDHAGADFQDILNKRIDLLEKSISVYPLRELSKSSLAIQSPNRNALREISKIRFHLYALALEAFLSLQDILQLKQDRLRSLFEQSVIASYDIWKRFELATGLCAAESIARNLDEPIKFGLFYSLDNLAQIGPFSIKWQYSLGVRDNNQLDISEFLIKNLTSSLGIGENSKRADIAIMLNIPQHKKALPLAFLECKWHKNESSQDSVKQSCSQLVRYARDAYPNSIENTEKTLQNSIVVLMNRREIPQRIDCLGSVNCIDFDGLAEGILNDWANSLIRTRFMDVSMNEPGEAQNS